jgi:stalled ribosome alternative rescue factor ArfA
MKNRNPIARNLWKFNKPKVVKAKKGKGAYVRKKVDIKEYRNAA